MYVGAHDPLCPFTEPWPANVVCDYCSRIAAAEMRGRLIMARKIAGAIEALPYDLRSGTKRMSGLVTFTRAEAYARCARIARSGGIDG